MKHEVKVCKICENVNFLFIYLDPFFCILVPAHLQPVCITHKYWLHKIDVKLLRIRTNWPVFIWPILQSIMFLYENEVNIQDLSIKKAVKKLKLYKDYGLCIN